MSRTISKRVKQEEWPGREDDPSVEPQIQTGLTPADQEQLEKPIIEKLMTFQIHMEQRVMGVINSDRGILSSQYQTVCAKMEDVQQLNNRVMMDQQQLRSELNAVFTNVHDQQKRVEQEVVRMQTDVSGIG